MSPRTAAPGTPSTSLPCDACGRDTEHREHLAGLTRGGEPRKRWRCVPCHAASSLASYHARKGPK